MLDVALLRFHRAPRSLAKGHRSYARAQKLTAYSRIQWFSCIGIAKSMMKSMVHFLFARYLHIVSVFDKHYVDFLCLFLKGRSALQIVVLVSSCILRRSRIRRCLL